MTTSSEYDMDSRDSRDEGAAMAEPAPAAGDTDSAMPIWVGVATGAAIGLAVGGALALLFAPKPGTELRSDLGARVDDLRQRAERTLDTLQETASDLVDRSRTTLEETRENLVRSIEAGKGAYEQKRDELNARLDLPTSGAGAAVSGDGSV